LTEGTGAPAPGLAARLAELSPARRRLLLSRLRLEPEAASAAAAAPAAGRPPLPRRDPGADPPLSFAQQRLWFVSQLVPGSPAYNVPGAVRLSGRLDRAALAGALTEVVRRHEVLRTRLGLAAGQVVQRIAAAAPVPLPLLDLGALAATAGAAERRLPDIAERRQPDTAERRQPDTAARRLLDATVERESCRPFDLARGPLLRALLVRLEPAEHVLVLTLHHIAADGWSIGVLLRELAALYGAAAAGRVSPLPELRIQYADFAVWQRQRLAGPVLAEQLAYWRRQLGGCPPLVLPTDRPHPPVWSSRGAHLAFSLGPLARQAAAFGRGRDATLFMTLQTALAALLSRHSGQLDLAVGMPIANRTHPEIEGLIGFFINTLVLRLDLSGDPSFGELAARVKELALAAYANQEVPFEKLVEELQPERDASRNPLFQVLFQVHNQPPAAVALPGLTLSPVAVPMRFAKFDLVLDVFERAGGDGDESRQGEGHDGTWTYATDLFDRTTVERLAGHFMVLLGAALAEPDRRWSELPLLTAAERHALLVEWNGGGEAAAGDLVSRFARQVAATPAAVAVEGEAAAGGWEQLSYAELEARANRLARYLRRLGAAEGELVALLLPRGTALVVAVLAVLKAGAAYLPLDPAYPEERLRLILDDSGARLLLTGSEPAGHLAAAAAGGCRLVSLDREAARIAVEKAAPISSGPRPGSLAYVIYTSGSTGRPKGVLVAHAQVARLHDATAPRFGFGPADVWTLFHSAAFDFSVWEMWGALLHGGRLVVVPFAVSRSPAELCRLLAERRVTVLNQTPSAFRQLLGAATAVTAGALALRWIVFGGEALDPRDVEAWWRLRGGAPTALADMYGITEITVHATFRRLSPAAAGDRAGAIGLPLPDLQVHVVGRAAAGPELAPIGAPGELWVGGAGVALGYLGRPALTAERFVPDPWGGIAGGRLYRSGDLGRRRRDGDLEYLGRIDHQVKLRGYRIELGEIEAALAVHPAIREVAVTLAGERADERRLVALLVLAPGEEEPRLGELRALAAARLPDYMVPAAFLPVPALPATPSGKLDRAALADLATGEGPGPLARPAEEARRPPRHALESLIAIAFAVVLRLQRVGLDDDFFELGGDSIKAAILANRLQDELGEPVPVVAVFQAPSPAALAGALGSRSPAAARLAALPVPDAAAPAGAAGAVGALPPIPVAPAAAEAPLSFAQERLWFLDQLDPGLPAYNLPLAVALTGRLRVGALARALGEVVRRHAVLRTTFGNRQGLPVQVIAPAAAAAPLPVVDLSPLPAVAGGAVARVLLAAAARQTFDLARGPLVRCGLLRLAAESHWLLVNLHHVVADGWSLTLLVRELSALYDAGEAGGAAALPELPLQYADFARWQRGYLTGDLLAAEVAHWRQRLAGLEPLALPTDRPRGVAPSRRSGHHRLALPGALYEQLRRFGQERAATLFMTLLAGFVVVLHRWTGQGSIVVGSPVANRTRRELEGLIGFFVNMLVLSVDCGGGELPFSRLLERVREAALAAYAHQEVPFEKLVGELEPRRERNRNPLFDVVFHVRDLPGEPPRLGELAIAPVATAQGAPKFDLNLSVGTGAADPDAWLEVDAELFDGATALRLLGHLGEVLTSLAAAARDAADPRLGELPLLSAAERAAVGREWNDTAAAYPEQTLDRLFAARAGEAPEAVAVVRGAEVVRYGELDRRANRLAHRLRALGVGPEVLVGVCGERSTALVAGLIAILKAGGAYLPLDPEAPPERLARLLAAVGAPVLLCGEEMAGRLPALPPGVAVLWLGEALAAPGPDRPPAAGTAPDNLAHVLFTSGSTGEPKAVGLAHRPVVRLVCNTGFARFGPCQVQILHSPLAFDAATMELWGSLVHGGMIVLPVAARPSLAELAATVARHRVSSLWLTAALFKVMVQEHLASLAGVGQLLAGGDVLPPAEVRQALQILRGTVLINGYGPTEDSTFTCCHRMHHAEELAAGGPVPIGRPIANTRVQVLDRGLRPVPVGVEGELYAAGDGLARGYLGQPALTAERFVPDPHGAPGQRLYRTGDRVRWRADGTLDFRGRLDDQVKIRGFRVEPREIEAVLGRHPAVAHAVVLAVAAATGEKRLEAYVAPRPGEAAGASLDAETLRDFLRGQVPSYMVPVRCVVLASLPRTGSGKIDRRALPGLAAGDLETAAGRPPFVAPEGEIEETLAALWQELLAVARVGASDDFFALGGHSLLATQLTSRLSPRLGREVPLRLVFEAPVLRDLAAAIAAEEAAPPPAAGTPPVPAAAATIPRAAGPAAGELDELLADLDRLTDEEARRLLAEEAAEPAAGAGG